MKRFVTHLSLIAAGAMVATGCVPTRHNLPPAQHLMEPGPGVGGPGPGVLGPAAYNGAAANTTSPLTSVAKADTNVSDEGGEIQQVGFIENLRAANCNTGCMDGGVGSIPPVVESFKAA